MLAPAESLEIEAGGPPAAHSLFFPAEQRIAGDSHSSPRAPLLVSRGCAFQGQPGCVTLEGKASPSSIMLICHKRWDMS